MCLDKKTRVPLPSLNFHFLTIWNDEISCMPWLRSCSINYNQYDTCKILPFINKKRYTFLWNNEILLPGICCHVLCFRYFFAYISCHSYYHNMHEISSLVCLTLLGMSIILAILRMFACNLRNALPIVWNYFLINTVRYRCPASERMQDIEILVLLFTLI